MVVKKDNSRELFNREKIKRGIIKSCEKRPVSIEQIESIISYVENEINKKDKYYKSFSIFTTDNQLIKSNHYNKINSIINGFYIYIA